MDTPQARKPLSWKETLVQMGFIHSKIKTKERVYPLDPNLAVAAHAVFPQSAKADWEKWPIFPYRHQIYQMKVNEKPFQM